jgi:signal peptidase I
VEDKEKNIEVEETKKKSKGRETIEAILIAVAVALFLRAFVVEAFKIPSSSMVPNLKIGDHIFVNKFVFGLRVPFTLKQMVSFKDPQRGEIIVFNFPDDPSKDYIKRLIALPGDKIRIDDDKLFVNGVAHERSELLNENDREILSDIPGSEEYNIFKETNANDISYIVMYKKQRMWGLSELECIYCKAQDGSELIVPKDMYFAMGDNRDNSSDSRKWGFIPKQYIKGRALFTWLSLNSDDPMFWIVPGIRWERFGRLIK